jgi:uncharacterized protein YbjT (DUF2867 family)
MSTSTSSTSSTTNKSKNEEVIKDDSSERKKIVVFGGSGFVGQGMIQEALKRGLDVISVNRSGAPKDFSLSEETEVKGNVDWIKGDIFHPEGWKTAVKGAEGAISCVGGFGSNEVSVVRLLFLLL